MALPKVKQLLPEEFKEVPWIGKLLTPLNSFMRSVYESLNKGLTVTENFKGEIKTVTMEGSSVSLAWTGEKPTVAFIGKVARTNGEAVSFTGGLTVMWEYTQEGKVLISDIIGLDDAADKKYSVTIMFLVN